jgi:lipid-A-disaccharide synthase-like uncharacterized protein
VIAKHPCHYFCFPLQPVIEFIEQYWVYGLGFFSQFLFGIRMLIQWYLSEKEGKIVSPVIFWQLSLVAGFLFILYGIFQNDFVIILGQGLSYIISLRNLHLEGAWKNMSFTFRASATLIPLVTCIWLFMTSAGITTEFHWSYFLQPIVFVGALGQILLNGRFLYQWYYAEKTKTSDLPLGFWLMTASGSVLVVIYALFDFEPVLLFAQGLGLIASIRNIQLHYKAKAAEA